MDFVEIATVIALLVNSLALLVVSYQTYLTRKAVEATRQSLDITKESLAATKESMDATKQSTELSIRTMQIEMLPSAGWVIQVQVDLERWLGDLESIIQSATTAAAEHDANRMQGLAQGSLTTPKGLVRRHAVENTPQWLSTIWLAGAQYYYAAKAPQASLWKKDTPWYDFVPDFVQSCRDSCQGIRELLKMIEDVVPSAYLHSPASLSDERFLD